MRHIKIFLRYLKGDWWYVVSYQPYKDCEDCFTIRNKRKQQKLPDGNTISYYAEDPSIGPMKENCIRECNKRNWF